MNGIRERKQRLRDHLVVGRPMLCLLVVLAGVWIFLEHSPASPFVDSFPDPDEIAEIVIPIQSPLKADESVPFIRVPESEFAALHALFEDGRIERNPLKWPLFYRLNMTLRDGDPMTLSVWYTNDEKGAFRVEDTYYRAASNAEFETFLRRILPEGVEILE